MASSSRAKSVASWATLESIKGMPATSFGNFTLVWEDIVVLFASLFSKKIGVGKVVPRTAVCRGSTDFADDGTPIWYNRQEHPEKFAQLETYGLQDIETELKRNAEDPPDIAN